MLKRIISVLVIVSILASFGTVAYGDTKLTDTIDKQFDTLVELGILNLDKEENLPPITYTTMRDLSKSGFINFVCNILGDYEFTERHSDEALRIAEDYGLIHKNQTDLYKMITYEEALTILVRLMGYEVHAQTGGGFPYGYVSIAKSIGLTDGITAGVGEPLQSHEVIALLYNAINCSYVEILGFTDEGVTYGQGSGKTVLHEMRGLYRIDGVLESTAERFLRPDETVSKGYVRINGYVYAADQDLTEYVGMDVTAYVKTEKEKPADTVQILFPDTNDEIIVASENINDVKNNFTELEYYDANDHLRTARIAKNASVLYNGQPLANYTAEAFRPADGSVKLINNDSDAEYDAVFITSFEGYIVDSISKSNEVIANVYTYKKELESLSFKVEDEETEIVKIFDAYGERIAFADLEEGDVIRAAKSTVDGRTVVYAYVSKEKVDGTVSQMRQENGTTYVTINGTEYETSAAYEKAVAGGESRATILKTGAGYTFYLDDAGRIAYVKSLAGTTQYAIAFATGSEGTFQKNCYIKLFTEQGEWLELPFANKIAFKGTRYAPENAILEIATAKRDDVINVIGYKTNTDGEIVSVELAEAYDDDGNYGRLNTKSFSNIKYYGGSSRTFNGELYLSEKATIWFVNEGEYDKEEAYSISSRDYLLNLQVYKNTYAYLIDEGKFADMVIVEQDASANRVRVITSELFVVDYVSNVLTSEGESMWMVTGAMNGYERYSYFADEEAMVSGLEKGDVISLRTNKEGYIEQIEPYSYFADIQAGNIYKIPATMTSMDAAIRGKVLKNNRERGWIKLDLGTKTEVIRTSNVTDVILYDLESDTISRGSLADIGKDDIVFTKLRELNTKTLIVYQ